VRLKKLELVARLNDPDLRTRQAACSVLGQVGDSRALEPLLARLRDREPLVGQAEDEDVGRLSIQVGNDTDDFRQPHYKSMPCRVSPQCVLSENTLRILRSTFGEVMRA